MKRKSIIGLGIVLLLGSAKMQAQQDPLKLAASMTQTVQRLWPDSFALKPGKPAKWSYDQGVILKGIEQLWKLTGDGKYFNYIQHSMDFYVSNEGTIKYYKPDEYNIDHLNNGRALMTLFAVTGKEKYKKALQSLYQQILTHPRTKEGSFWHKQIYPSQVWLDGLYMGQPFYAEYARRFGIDSCFTDIVRQFKLIELHTRQPKTGLMYHGWDESKEQLWANKTTGCSPNVWARAMGWYGMALVDVLDYIPQQHPGRKDLLEILQRFANAIRKYQDPVSGTWYDVVDLPKQKGNYHEASASCMFTYVLAKSVRKGYISPAFRGVANKAFNGIVKEFVRDSAGVVTLKGTVSVSGLGGKPYRDGSFEYYMSEPVIDNDPKGIGAFLLCCAEIQHLRIPSVGAGKKIVMDHYFNNEWRKNGFAVNVRRHYTWDDDENGGFSLFAELWENTGAKLGGLDQSPNARNLKDASVYVMVDPDGWKDTKTPNYMTDSAATAITNWVKGGGVLLLMTNDSSNCDLEHFNTLAHQLGIHFTNKSLNMVKDNQFVQGLVVPKPGNTIFKSAGKLYLKEVGSIELRSKNWIPVLQNETGDIILATAKLGKGTVLAVTDPWLYNEYLDGRKLPEEFQNYQAARELINWLLLQVKTTQK